jgi:hypothetical protein
VHSSRLDEEGYVLQNGNFLFALLASSRGMVLKLSIETAWAGSQALSLTLSGGKVDCIYSLQDRVLLWDAATSKRGICYAHVAP